MRFVSFVTREPSGSVRHLGVVRGGDVIDLTRAAEALFHRIDGLAPERARQLAAVTSPPSMIDMIAMGPIARDIAERAVDTIEARGWEAALEGAILRYPYDELAFLPAIQNAPMLRDFMAFEEHLSNIYPRLDREIPAEWYVRPAYYKGNPNSVGAHRQDIVLPSYAGDELDMEFEFAAIIGVGGVNIPREEALRHVFGFTIYNDFSARGIQSRELTIGLGPAKGKDFVGGHVLGPVVVTVDEITDPYTLEMTARVNGEVWTQRSTSGMHWRFEDMIAYASTEEELRVGEIFGSGTVGNGSAAEQGRSLGVGDEVELHVEGIGTLVNRLVRNDRAAEAPA